MVVPEQLLGLYAFESGPGKCQGNLALGDRLSYPSGRKCMQDDVIQRARVGDEAGSSDFTVRAALKDQAAVDLSKVHRDHASVCQHVPSGLHFAASLLMPDASLAHSVNARSAECMACNACHLPALVHRFSDWACGA
jgi:hypothetical protein